MKPINIKRLIGVLLCLTMILSGTVMAFAAELDEPVTEDPAVQILHIKHCPHIQVILQAALPDLIY